MGDEHGVVLDAKLFGCGIEPQVNDEAAHRKAAGVGLLPLPRGNVRVVDEVAVDGVRHGVRDDRFAGDVLAVHARAAHGAVFHMYLLNRGAQPHFASQLSDAVG